MTDNLPVNNLQQATKTYELLCKDFDSRPYNSFLHLGYTDLNSKKYVIAPGFADKFTILGVDPEDPYRCNKLKITQEHTCVQLSRALWLLSNGYTVKGSVNRSVSQGVNRSVQKYTEVTQNSDDSQNRPGPLAKIYARPAKEYEKPSASRGRGRSHD